MRLVRGSRGAVHMQLTVQATVRTAVQTAIRKSREAHATTGASCTTVPRSITCAVYVDTSRLDGRGPLFNLPACLRKNNFSAPNFRFRPRNPFLIENMKIPVIRMRTRDFGNENAFF